MLSFLSKIWTPRPDLHHWDAPDYFHVRRGPRSNIDLEKEAAQRRLRSMRNVGMW